MKMHYFLFRKLFSLFGLHVRSVVEDYDEATFHVLMNHFFMLNSNI